MLLAHVTRSVHTSHGCWAVLQREWSCWFSLCIVLYNIACTSYGWWVLHKGTWGFCISLYTVPFSIVYTSNYGSTLQLLQIFESLELSNETSEEIFNLRRLELKRLIFFGVQLRVYLVTKSWNGRRWESPNYWPLHAYLRGIQTSSQNHDPLACTAACTSPDATCQCARIDSPVKHVYLSVSDVMFCLRCNVW